jgi:outer membrane murein-binding lipoprotein Lpp
MTNIRTHLAVVAVALFASTLAAPPASAQTPQDLARELANLRAEVERLRAEVDALKSGAAAPAAAPVEILQAQVAELAETKVESSTRFPVKLFGTLHASVFTNSGNANWLDNPNLVAAPFPDGQPGTLSISARQTRIGFLAGGPSVGPFRSSAFVAMDFFGGIPGFQTGQVMGLPRLLMAFGRLESERTAVEVGQDYMILAPRDPSSLAAYAFPLLYRSGNLYMRVPQVRVEQKVVGGLRATAGIVAPVAGDLVGDAFLFVPPALSGERSRRPGVQGRLAYVAGDPELTRAVDVGVSGHRGWERRGANLAPSWASALDLSARLDVIGVAGEYFVGENIDAFGGGTGLDARSTGGWGQVQLFPSRRLSFAAGAGVDDIRDPRRSTLARQRNQSAFANVIFSITPELETSFEYRQLRTLVGTTDRRNQHFDWVFVHRF